MIFRVAVALLILAAIIAALTPPERWDFIDGPLPVPDDELRTLNQV